MVKSKTDNTPWSQIMPTHVDIPREIKFEVGELSEEDQLKEDKEIDLKNERIKKGKMLKENYRQSNKVYELPENQEEIERLMLEEEFNVTQENLTIVNEISNYIIEENETSLGKRT